MIFFVLLSILDQISRWLPFLNDSVRFLDIVQALVTRYVFSKDSEQENALKCYLGSEKSQIHYKIIFLLTCTTERGWKKRFLKINISLRK